MRDFIDRQPIKPGRRKLIKDNGDVEYVTVEMADEATVEGTLLNREAMMALQGFQAKTTVFNPDGSITETNVFQETLVTVFLEDGSILQTFTNTDGLSISLKTIFNSDGSISEEVLHGDLG